MTLFEAAQPALLYLVPCTFFGVVGRAYYAGELQLLLEYDEAEKDPAEKDKKTE